MKSDVRDIILITGASGLLGSNMIKSLLANEIQVIGISKSYPLKDQQLDLFESDLYISIEGDITNLEFLQNLIDTYQPTVIIHLAAQAIVEQGINSPINTFETNIRGTWNVLETARLSKNLRLVILASSDKAYGSHSELPYLESHALNAIHPYDLSKKVTEEIAQSYVSTYNLPITITRCGNIFGPFDLNYSRIVPGTIKSCIENKQITIRSNGKQTRCYIYVKDVVNAYLAILNAPLEHVKGEAFNIGTSEQISVLELAEKICELSNTDISNIKIENTSKFEITNQSLDSSKANKILGWKPIFSIDQALKETIEWYKSYIDK